MLYTMLPPQWLRDAEGAKPIQKECSLEQALEYNRSGYNIYYYPNYPSPEAYAARKNHFVQAPDIDRFEWAILDLDLKHGAYQNEVEFIERLMDSPYPPTKIRLSGHGVHGLWRVTDLDGMSFLRLSRRLCRLYKSDEAVCSLKQLLRVPGTVNTKNPEDFQLCEEVYSTEDTYTSEQLDKWLPPITAADETYCRQHCDRAHNPEAGQVKVDEKLPRKFKKLLAESREAKEIFAGDVSDRSRADYRLAHLMLVNGFTRDEMMSVLVNCSKALERSPAHRIGYAEGILDKVWTFESGGESAVPLSSSVRDILKRGDAVKGTRLPCWEVFDATHHGFRLTEVLGLIGGSGSGKTTLALNYFYHFARLNPGYHHLFVSLEQPEEEVAVRWARICGDNDSLHDKVHVLGNYDPDGQYRNLSLKEIEAYVLKLQSDQKIKIGCVVIDHIGVLKKTSKDGESQGLIDICHYMKAFAKATNTFLVMQSQTNREKAGIGDVELDKSAAFGTSMFENYCDLIVTTWQPLKRIYDVAPHMTCSAFKYCKIRKKNVLLDRTKEDVVHVLMYDPNTELLTLMNQEQEEAYVDFSDRANKLRNKDRKREPTRITKIDWVDPSEGK